MRWRDIQLNLQKFEQEAKKLLDETVPTMWSTE